MGACTAKQPNKKQNVTRCLMPFKVCMQAFIWSKNSHNLFDFESNQYTRKEIEVDFTSRLATLENDLLALTKKEWARNQTDIVDLTLEDEQSCWLAPVSQKQDQRVWAIIKNKNLNSDFNSIDNWTLRQNDIIKLGRIRLQLIDFAFLKKEDPEVKGEDEKMNQGKVQDDQASLSQDYQGQESEQIMCRICFSRRASVENPLISPCLCTGSVKYIHVQCLQSWIGVQLKIKKGENFIQYTWKKMQCEICKAVFKSSYLFQGRSYGIMNIPKPKSSFLTMRVTSDDKQKEGMIYVIEFQDKTELKIGRVPECDIKLKDISVSRQHAIIKLIPTEQHTPENPSYQLRLQDINSKFGTLIYAQWEDLLKLKDLEQPILYQIGRVLVNFNIKKKPKKSSVSCYKHPEGVQLLCISQLPLNENATIAQNQQGDGSFQTHNELNMSDIVIHDAPAPIPNISASLPLPATQPQPIPNMQQTLQPVQLQVQFRTQPQPRQIDDDLSVCDEHQQVNH